MKRHHQFHPMPSSKKLCVISVISNQVRYESRYYHYKKFTEHMRLHGANHLTVECAFGDRPFEVTEEGNPWHLRLRTWDELWHKENMINLGIAHLNNLMPDWEYVVWIDADISFQREDWIEETVHQLQHHMFVQMFQTAIDTGPTGEAFTIHQSFMSQYKLGKPYCFGGKNAAYYEQWHPGYCWGARREAIDHVGLLIDTAILGAGDNHMAHAMIGKMDGTLAEGLHPNYIKHLKIWQERCERHIRRDVGFVPGTIIHYWHGKKRDRRYHDRWRVLTSHKYDPERDLKRDHHGLYQLVDHGDLRSIRLRDDIRNYFRMRHEDSIDLV